MKSQNICKFAAPSLICNTLLTFCFVRETDGEIMRRTVQLAAHRLLLVTQGSGSLSIDGTLFPLRSGTLLFALENEEIALADGEDIVYMYIDFSGIRADELLRRFEITPLSRIYSCLDGLIPLWQESLSGASADTVDLAAESILLYSFSKLFGAASERNGLIGQIARITEQGFSNPALSLATVARELSYHPKYISNLFKRKMGVGYAEYLRSVRIKHAITLLDHGIESIKNVALLSGFTDPLYFSSVFKKCTGTSPTEYLRSKAK